MSPKYLLVVAIAWTGCASGLSDASGDAHVAVIDGQAIDAPAVVPDAALAPDATPDAGILPGDTLLLSEITLTPDGYEFIEIVNPTNASVDLTNYYVSDNGNYFKLPASGSGVPLDQGDFIAQFPAGDQIASDTAITIAFDTAANFATHYGVQPTYSIGDATIKIVAVSGTPSLTNAGELVALFEWDGHTDLVRDVDLMLAGNPSAAAGTSIGNGLFNKSGYSQDGPDAGNVASKYLTDSDSMPKQAVAPAAGYSTKRIKLETGNETQTGGGNGLSGDDETSENTAITWDTTFTAPTPNVAVSALTL